jgi:hypothetical protein
MARGLPMFPIALVLDVRRKPGRDSRRAREGDGGLAGSCPRRWAADPVPALPSDKAPHQRSASHHVWLARGWRNPADPVRIPPGANCGSPSGMGRRGTEAPTRHSLRTVRSFQLGEQRLCFFEIGSGEALGEPAVDRAEQVAGCGAATLVAPQSGKARGGA